MTVSIARRRTNSSLVSRQRPCAGAAARGALGVALAVTASACVLRAPQHGTALAVNAALLAAGGLALYAGLPKDSCDGECRPDGGLLAGGTLLIAGSLLGMVVTSALYLHDAPPPAPRQRQRRAPPRSVAFHLGDDLVHDLAGAAAYRVEPGVAVEPLHQ
jgi:hypothetical protein